MVLRMNEPPGPEAVTRPFRFGNTLFPVMSSRDEWRDQVRRAEQAGISIITLSDHFRSSGGIFSAAQAVYETAPSMRVGTLVLNNDFWPPSLLAREVITTDVLTNGAFELGIGAGWDEPDYLAIGLERRPPAERVERLAESIQILRQAFAGEPVQLRGRHYTVDGGAAWPKPVQARIPIVIGGGSPRILALAGAQADIVSIHRNLQRGVAGSWEREKAGKSEFADAVTERVHWVRDAAGARFHDIELNAIVLKTIFTDRRADAAAELGRANGLSAEQVLASPHYLVGEPAQMAEDLIRRRERWGISYWTLVGGGEVASFGKVVAQLSGT
jgi:probable F420-dependent oxidoreductase